MRTSQIFQVPFVPKHELAAVCCAGRGLQPRNTRQTHTSAGRWLSRGEGLLRINHPDRGDAASPRGAGGARCRDGAAEAAGLGRGCPPGPGGLSTGKPSFLPVPPSQGASPRGGNAEEEAMQERFPARGTRRPHPPQAPAQPLQRPCPASRYLCFLSADGNGSATCKMSSINKC